MENNKTRRRRKVVPAAVEPLSRLVLDIPKVLHTRIKVASAVQQRSMRDVLIEVLERHFPSDDSHEESAAPGS